YPVLGDQLAELYEFGFHLTLLQLAGRVYELRQLDNFLAQSDWVIGGDKFLQFGNDLLLLVVWQVFELLGEATGDMLLRIGFGISKDFLALFLHAFEAAPYREDAGREATLQHGHSEAESAAPSGVFGGGLDGLVLDVTGEGVVEIPFVVGDLELCGL